jgi:tRNA threonylcarbamoyladenosine biosynthesis protein TsaE
MTIILSMISLHLADEDATLNLGRALATHLQPGLTIFLQGDLGAGKTTLMRGVLRGLSFEGLVKSPTYTLVESYLVSSLYLYHFDLYRFKHEQEWLDAGFNELFNERNICFVEWPERARTLLPEADITIELAVEGDGRRVNILSKTVNLENLQALAPAAPS